MVDNLNEIENLVDQEEEIVNQNDSDDREDYNDSNDGSWISWFCQLEGNEFLVEIDENFIRSNFNILGLQRSFKDYHIYIKTILSQHTPSEAHQTSEEFVQEIEKCRELYGLIHARFITSAQGIALVREKYLNSIYGVCPRILCDKQILLPIGISEDLKYSRVFCPKCEEIYKPKQKCSDIDGAFFGSSFPQLFLMTYPDLNPRLNNFKQYVPKLYGFKIFGKRGSKYYKDKKQD